MSIAEGEEGELEGEATQLGDFAVQSGDSVVYQYPIGSLVPIEGSPSISAILVGVLDAGALFCFPHFAWHRKAQHRLLPPGSFKKPVRVVVPGCLAGDMEQASDTSITVAGLLGVLPRDAGRVLRGDTGGSRIWYGRHARLATSCFGDRQCGRRAIQFPLRRIWVSGSCCPPCPRGGSSRSPPQTTRGQFQGRAEEPSLPDRDACRPEGPCRKQQGPPGSGQRTPAGSRPGRRCICPSYRHSRSALAGDGEDFRKGPRQARGLSQTQDGIAANKDPLSESSSQESMEEAEGATSADAQVAKAVGQLTKVVKVLAAEKVKSQAKNPLEQLLDRASSSSTGDPSRALATTVPCPAWSVFDLATLKAAVGRPSTVTNTTSPTRREASSSARRRCHTPVTSRRSHGARGPTTWVAGKPPAVARAWAPRPCHTAAWPGEQPTPSWGAPRSASCAGPRPRIRTGPHS